MLRYDGIYATGITTDDSGMPYRQYLRFYEDGTVLDASSIGTPAQVARWLVKDKRDLSSGRYTVDGDRIAFTTHSEHVGRPDSPAGDGPRVVIDYEGTVSHGALTLHSHSHFNGYEERRGYAFVAFDVPA